MFVMTRTLHTSKQAYWKMCTLHHNNCGKFVLLCCVSATLDQYTRGCQNMSKGEESTQPDMKKMKLEANEVSNNNVLISDSASPAAMRGIGGGDHVKAGGVSLQQTSDDSTVSSTAPSATGKDFSFSKEPTLEQM